MTGLKPGDVVAVSIGGWFHGQQRWAKGEVVKVTPKQYVDIKVLYGSKPVYRFAPDGSEHHRHGTHWIREIDDVIGAAIAANQPVVQSGWTDDGKLVRDETNYPRRVRRSTKQEA